MTRDELSTILLRSWEMLSVLAFVDPDAYDRMLEAELRVTAQSMALLVMEKLQIAIEGVEEWKS